MKIIAIGDIHGRKDWEKIVADNRRSEKIIFIGDYFDSFDIPFPAQMENFKNIIAYKKANPDKVVLFFGNHEYHYLRTTEEHHKGYQALHHIDIGEAIHKALNELLFQVCFLQGDYLFSHAGFTKTWCKNHKIKMKTLEKSANDLFRYKPISFSYRPNNSRKEFDRFGNGDTVSQSPIWVRPKSLMLDKLDKYIQVVGHTERQNIDVDGDVIFIDTLGTSGEYLTLEI